MELKDVILSTLAELDSSDESEINIDTSMPSQDHDTPPRQPQTEFQHVMETENAPEDEREISDEIKYLESIKERMLVLFEGFQSPNNTAIEAKVDLTLNFLEYLLSTIDSRLDNLKKRG